jgi:hypothetical protein
MMGKVVKVRIIGSDKVKKVTLEEARKILESVCNDSLGGFVIDAKTGQVLSQIGPDIEEIVVVEHMLGGG